MADLNALALFSRVVESNSFSGAARRLRLPVSTVSRRIADLEKQLGVRLLERSTRSLRLTSLGAELLEHARHTTEISDLVETIVADASAHVAGSLRLAAPPSLAEPLLAPLLTAYQRLFPDVRIQVSITERVIDQIADGIDLAFRFGDLRDSSLVARRVLLYRHRLVASPSYLATVRPPRTPQDLLRHRLLAFSFGRPARVWNLVHTRRKLTHRLTFHPHLAMNDYAGLAVSLSAGAGIGDLPPLIRPDLLRDGALTEVLPAWRLRPQPLSLTHLGGRYLSRPVRSFQEFALHHAPRLFPHLPA